MAANRALLLPKSVGHVRLVPRQTRRPSGRLAATTAGAAVADLQLNPQSCTQQHLRAALEDLESVHTTLADDELDAKVVFIENLSNELGTNKPTPDLIEGYFKPYALSGRLKRVLSTSKGLNLGALTFAAVKPVGLKAEYNHEARLRSVWKGDKGGLRTHMLPTTISIDGLPAVLEAVMSWDPVPDNPRAILISSREIVLFPELEERKREEQLQQWLQLLGPANKAAGNTVDAATGRIVAVVEKAVSVHLDCLVAIPGWNLYRSANGSCSLLRQSGGVFADE